MMRYVITQNSYGVSDERLQEIKRFGKMIEVITSLRRQESLIVVGVAENQVAELEQYCAKHNLRCHKDVQFDLENKS